MPPTATPDGPGRVRLAGLPTAALASIAAGAIHGAVAGVHAEHPALARWFVVVAAAQIAAGLVALIRPDRRAGAWAMAAANTGAVAAWTVTRLRGVSWMAGLEAAESIGFADTACAALGVIAAGLAGGALLLGPRSLPAPRLAVPGVAIAALALPAMLSGGSTAHGHDIVAPSSAAASAASTSASTSTHAHDEQTASHPADDPTTPPPSPPASPIVPDSTVPNSTVPIPGESTTGWPRPWDPASPVDLTGVAGVSAAQQARATALVRQSLVALPRWASPDTAIADGYRSIGDAATGSEHFIKSSLINDDVMLDPTQPESLVYTVDGDRRTLAGAMFIASARPTDDPTLTQWAGPLMTWHNHGDLCFGLRDGSLSVVGTTRASGGCAEGVNAGAQFPMVHVWITAHPCGVFAALEGVGAGQAAVSDAERTDMCAPAHDHQSAAPATPSTPNVAASPVPYDPAMPIDLSGTPGVTPAQQAAAENLVAVTVVRLPQWADYRVAEAAGFRSIGDAATGVEHFINWAWINDDVQLDPDKPESLVYEPQPDGSRKLVSAMYMLADTVALEDVPDIGGALMQWHIHDNLCFTTDPAQPRVGGLTDASGGCPAGLQKFPPAAMIHVWITPHPCGPFAALEGLGAGQIAPGEERLCDHAHGSGGLLG